MYEAAATDEDEEILRSLQNALADFQRIKEEIARSAGRNQTERAQQGHEKADLGSTLV
jgi:hypothetical protein